MKTSEIIERLNKDPSNSHFLESESFFDELGLDETYVDMEIHGFSAYYAAAWYCTDQAVGHSVIFYRDEPIALMYQSARKASPEYTWIGGAKMRDKMFHVCLPLVSPECPTSEVREVGMDNEWGLGIKVAFSTQLLVDKLILDETGEIVEVVYPKNRHNVRYDHWHLVSVLKEDGSMLRVKMEDVTIPFNVLPETTEKVG